MRGKKCLGFKLMELFEITKKKKEEKTVWVLWKIRSDNLKQVHTLHA